LDVQTKKQKSLHEGEMRLLLKEGLTIQYQSFADFSQKLSTLAHFGKHMVSQIPQGTVAPGQDLPPYMGAPVTKKIRDGRVLCLL
jgi:alkylated DNA nucleotide flippase Atl1